MTPKQILDSFSETLMQDEQILSPQERALLLNLLRHARASTHDDPETCAAVNTVIASAVGETVAQRAFAVLGSSIVEQILASSGSDSAFDDSIAAIELARKSHKDSPKPKPTSPQPPGPQPPGLPKPTGPQPPGLPKPTTPQPPGPQPPGLHPPKEQPLKDVPGPQPPGSGPHGATVHRVNGRVFAPETAVSVLERPETLTARCVVLDEFLAPQEADGLLSYALAHEADFRSSEVISPVDGDGIVNYEHRRSKVLMDAGAFESLIFERIQNVLPSVLQRLGIQDFPVRRVECQITASNDGDFFRNHHDNCEAEVASRELTFVYFFHNEPRRFEGGELRIHDARLAGGQYVRQGSYHGVVPMQNQIVFFPCSLLHEITPVECRSRLFADSRFTLNGWLHK